MGFFDRLAKGWEIGVSSLKVLNANKQLIIFPVLSGLSMILIVGSFVGFFIAGHGHDWDYQRLFDNKTTMYGVIFLFYVVNYLIVVFFNMALMHCTKLYFEGEEALVSKGLQFSASRIGAIFSWALFAATVGMVLKIAQDNLGWVGKIITGLIGVVWSIATFFAIPVIAYENVGPVDALKRSAELMKEKWGESLGARFSFGIFLFIGLVGSTLLSSAVGYFVNPFAGFALFAIGCCLTFIVFSALNSIFVSAVYNNINGNVNQHFRQQLLDDLFTEKGK